MLRHLVILLDDTSIAYCHIDNPLQKRNIIPLNILKKAIDFAMRKNLMVQYVYPNYNLPEEYENIINSIDHLKIGHDIQVFNSIPESIMCENIVLRTNIKQFIQQVPQIANMLRSVTRLNICITDIETFNDLLFADYNNALEQLNNALLDIFETSDNSPNVNILTDILELKEMRNCDAGIGNITVAPNGKFYLCPAFYYDEVLGVNDKMHHKNPTSDFSVGDVLNGINIKNKYLLKLENAPLCRKCDAYHCHRCIYLNNKLTWENNTPSRQQCVMAHLERNASRNLQQRLITKGAIYNEIIKEIDYLDPFDKFKN